MIRICRCVAILCLVLLASAPAWAIPTNPDPIHTQAATPWPNPLPMGFNPANTMHQHYNADNLNGVVGKFDAYSVWDDSNYRYNAAADVEAPNFGHGYMQNGATYTYDPAVPIQAVALFNNNVVNYWENAINGPKLNSNNHPINTLMDFNTVAYNGTLPNGGADILIKFALTYPVGPAGGTVETPFPSGGSLPSDGSYPGGVYPPQGGGPQGGRDGVLAFWTPSKRQITFNASVNWYYNTVGNPAVNQFDFITTALHEFGHALGLDHEGAMGTVMFGLQASDNVDGSSVVRFLDAGTKDGSISLYSIAVPEPASVLLLAMAAMAPMLMRRRS